MSSLADRIIDQIDAGQLNPRTHRVCRCLAGHLSGLSGVGPEVIHAFDEGRSIGDDSLARRLWAEIENLPVGQQGSWRILVSLLRADEAVDSHLAEYLIGWSEDEGVSNASIIDAFGAS